MLLGGGGVPEGDNVSLGLGPRLISAYKSPLVDKQDKDQYAGSGYLEVQRRKQLLGEWEPQGKLQTELEVVGSEISRLQQLRSETASSPRDQRFMPTNQSEAVEVASRDEAIARKVVATKPKPSSLRGAAETSRARLASPRASPLSPPRSIMKRRKR